MGIGIPELIVIFLMVLLLFGPRKLPEIARTIGKSLAEFRKIADGSFLESLDGAHEDGAAMEPSRSSPSPRSLEQSNHEGETGKESTPNLSPQEEKRER
jgi:sec-independent protein translocase protein TatA